ncbi:hypothetical protein MSAN_00015000 [Mycena sanguinolenta]|uniref:Sacsin/Nov domain-containing protein n=1 Tax=Mycena sanguinolenta TaxID=230812 RepID=A0A8H7DKT1_9AGAR|nr:hypothetical protein MSAN_00015000 [Mycena sanguinolenta]
MAQSRDALWAAGVDESVEVNQRALIDKVLARYSGEFTVFRELLQNSDDAQSRRVEIRFQTQAALNAEEASSNSEESTSKPALPDLKTALCHQWTFKNDGMTFRKEDWDRLKKIAEGNPDEEKIGAFGVGFYSLFSVTDDPLVKSGAEWMGFYWKDNKDQLFARRGSLPTTADNASNVWTSFEMPLRQPVPAPVAFDFIRFLASSITFMQYLAEVSVYFDDKRLVRLRKDSGVPKPLEIPKALRKRSHLGKMTVTGVNSTSLRIQAETMRWVYSSGTAKPKPLVLKQEKAPTSTFFNLKSWLGSNTPQRVATPLPPEPEELVDPLTVNETSVSLSIFSAEADVHLDEKFAAELQRSTKKHPPRRIFYQLIYTAKDEYDASKKEDEQQPFATGSIFQGLRADIDGTGATRVFIGHATGQTTGLGGHMAARFIPTVERESIDLMDRNVAMWNKELLWVGGFLARAAYERELADVRDLWNGAIQGTPSDKDMELQTWLQVNAFKQTSPLFLEAAFFSCAPNSDFPLISTVGVRPASMVRLPDPRFSFLRELPVLPDQVEASAGRMVKSLKVQGLIKPIILHDVLSELRARPLPEADMIACLKWWIDSYNANPDPSMLTIRTELLNAAVLLVGKPGSAEEQIIPLSGIKTFMNPRSFIPMNGPLPNHLLPIIVSKHLPAAPIISSSLPWNELSVAEWLRHICSPAVRGPSAPVAFNLDLSPQWAERVLSVLAAAWPSSSNPTKAEIAAILKNVPYLFHDLPVVTLPSGTPIRQTLENVLQALGVRKHVDLQVVFDRMIKTNEWSIFELTRYLVDTRSSLTADEWGKLKMTAAFSKEAGGGEKDHQKRRAKELYEPIDSLRQLGLPVIDWGQHKWKASSDQAKLLFDLGLMRYPRLDMLISLCAGPNAQIRPIALKFLLDNLSSRYKDYNPPDFYDIPYLPALQDGKPVMGAPKDVFAVQDWTVFGYLVFAPPGSHPDAALKLKIQQHPPTARLVSLLASTPPKSEEEARKWFSALATRISDFSNTELVRLSQLSMVPTRPVDPKAPAGTLRWLPPTQCFFDFGTAANGFLSACGTKHSPSIEEIALMLLANPHRFYELANGPSNFMTELRNLAINQRQISSSVLSRMKKSPILLGMLRKTTSSGDFDDDEKDLQYDLKRPDEIVIADDNNALQNFGDALFTAPQEDILEGFYMLLGSRRLSSLVKEEYKTSSQSKDQQTAIETRALILERLPLFLHEHTHARTRVTYNWLNQEAHFIVTCFGKLSVTKTLDFGDIRTSRTQEASAAAKRIGSGPINLWLAGNAQVDMYEVATSLNRLLFDSPKTNDALLFMTILSTDLKALKRRGYNVDRILRQQNALRQAAVEEAKAKNAQLMKSGSGPVPQPVGAGEPMPSSSAAGPMLPPPPPPSDSKPRPSSGMFQQLKRKINTTMHPGDREKSGVLPPPSSTASRSRSKTVTPLSNIASNIDMAIQACRPEAGHLLKNREQMQQVQESLNEGYCDISGRVGDLNVVGEIGNIKVYLSQEVPEPHSFIPSKYDPLTRFVPIIGVLAQVYNLPLTSLHIFYDLDGGLIAFNRNGSIFFNLRYYEAWHDADVKAGRTQAAYISWYFTLAHEIAHNLVHPHNSEHEFYFSAICEKYFPAILARALSRVLLAVAYHIQRRDLYSRRVCCSFLITLHTRGYPSIQMVVSTSVLKAPGVSSIRRRKPMRTYQSPSTADRAPTIAKTLSALSHQLASASASASASSSTSSAQSTGTAGIVIRTDGVVRNKYPMAPPLPLYHPLGRLALSLPPLEPSHFGHSPPISVDDSDSGRRSSARSRRPAAKLRDAEEDEVPNRAPISNVSAIAAVAAREIKEKASPRKRRGGGGGAKRKRKDAEDGDATYPAKRTRNPRGISNLLEDESPSGSMVPLPDVTPTPEPTGEQLDDKQQRPERRATRSSNGASKRRDSNASTSTASASVAPPAPPSDGETRQDARTDSKDAKEEGEVSEETP